MITAIIQALKTGYDICRLKKGPADMPHFGRHQSSVLIFYAAVYLAINVTAQHEFFAWLEVVMQQSPELEGAISIPANNELWLAGSLQIISFGLLFYALLMFKNIAARFSQSFTAFIVVGCLFGLALLALINIMFALPTAGLLGSFLSLVMLALVILNVLVIVKIIRETVEIPWGFAVLLLFIIHWGSSLFAGVLSYAFTGSSIA